MAYFALANLYIKDTTYKEILGCQGLQYNNTARPKISTTGMGDAVGTSIPGRAEPDDVTSNVIYNFSDTVHQLLDTTSSDTEKTFKFVAQDGSSTTRYFKGKLSQWPALPTIAEGQAAQKSLQILVTAAPQATDFA